MTLNDWLTLAGVVISPIVAVGITLWIEGRRRDREGKMVIVRLLMATRHLPGDPNYSTAINLLPVEFSKCPDVMAAYKEYGRLIRREQATTDNGKKQAEAEMGAAQTKLIAAVLRAVGMPVSEADLPVEAYAASGFIARDNLYLGSLEAQPRIAEALEESVRINRALLSGQQSQPH